MGRGMLAIPGAAATAADLLRAMDRSGVERALVWHLFQCEGHAADGNRLLSAAILGQPRLTGCWTILPPQTMELPAGQIFFNDMAANNARALRAFPGHHNYSLRRSVFGRFLDEVAERRIPLLLSLLRHVTWESLSALLEDYPLLICLLCDTGIWGQDRRIYPLLERYQHVLVDTSLVSLEAGGLETAVKHFGPERFIFGSGFPERYAESPMLDLLHADVPESGKDLIAHGNIERLLSEVRL